MRTPEIAIGELVSKCSTWDPRKSDKNEFIYVDLSSVDNDQKRITSAERVSCSEAPSRARQLVKANDVLVATVRPNLNGVALVGAEHDGATASTGYCVLRPNPKKLDARFLFHWVKSPIFIERMIDVATGANYPAVSDAKVKNSLLPFPALTEQKRIAKILDAADALRARRRESIAQLDALLQSTFLEMFGDPVTNPKGWEVATMGNVAEILTGFAFQSDQFLSAGQGIALCRGINVAVGKLNWKERADWDADEYEKLSRFKLREGDIVLALDRPWISSGLKIALVEKFDLPALLVQRVARIRAQSPALQHLLFALIQKSSFQKHCNTTETTIPHISPNDLRSFPVYLPSHKSLLLFEELSNKVQEQKSRLRTHLAELDALFASLQARAFAGEL